MDQNNLPISMEQFFIFDLIGGRKRHFGDKVPALRSGWKSFRPLHKFYETTVYFRTSKRSKEDEAARVGGDPDPGSPDHTPCYTCIHFNAFSITKKANIMS